METSGHGSGDVVAGVDEARRLIGDLSEIKDQTRADFRDGTWQWLIIWAVVCCGAAVSAFTPFAGWYWILGVPLGMMATAVIIGRAETRSRIRRKAWPYVAVSVAIGVANGAASFLFQPEVIVVAIWVVLGLGFAALTWLDRIPTAPGVFLMLTCAAVVAGVAARDSFQLYPVLAMAFASVLAVFAFATWRGVPE